MKNDFYCPHCDGCINPRENLIFSIKTESDDSGIVLLSPVLGDYTITKHRTFHIKEGETIKLLCPICHKDLSMKGKKSNLAKIIMKDREGKKHDIVFSGLVGEQCTYKVSGEDIESFGTHATRYIKNLFEK